MAETPSRSNSILVGIIVLVSMAGVGFMVWRHRERRFQNERNALMSVRTLLEAEAKFRFNGNANKEFWTGDVAGLHGFGLIDRSIAEADTRPRTALVSIPIPKDGYYFKVLKVDRSIRPPEVYSQPTDEMRFGFCAYPAEPGVTGNEIFIVNENNTVFRSTVQKVAIPEDWPTDREIVQFWTRPGMGLK